MEVRDNADQTTSYMIGTLVDYPQDAPNLTYPGPCELITNQTPTFTWDAYSFSYNGTPASFQNYNLDLWIQNGDGYGLSVSSGQTSEGYGDHEWWNHNTQQNEYLPRLPVGSHSMNIGVHLDTGTPFSFWTNQHIQFQYAETNPDIVSAEVNLNYYVNHYNSQVDEMYEFSLWVNALGDFSGMDISDITILADGTVLNLESGSLNVDLQGCDNYHINVWGSYSGIPVLGEYVVEVRDSSDQTTSYIIGTLIDYPQTAPNLIHPTHCELITNQTPRFMWDMYSFTYGGNSLSAQNYSLNLNIYNGDGYGLWIPNEQMIEGYSDHEWWNHNTQQDEFLPPLPVGSHGLSLGAHSDVDTNFSLSTTRYIQFQSAETNPDISNAHMNISYNVNHHNGQVDSWYNFGVSVDVIGDFSSMQISDIRVMVVGDNDLNLDNFNIYSNGCNRYHIDVGGEFIGTPILSEYIVEVRDNSSQTTAHSIGTLLDYPQDAPSLTYPVHTQIISEQEPTFTWNSFDFTYNGNSIGVSDYCLDLAMSDGQFYSLWNIPAGQTSEVYDAHLWWNHNNQQEELLQPLPSGNHALNLGAYQNVDAGFSFSANRNIQFECALARAEDVNGDGVVNILDLVLISIHFGRQVNDGLVPLWTSIGDGSIPDQADVNDDGVVNILDMVRVSIAFD